MTTLYFQGKWALSYKGQYLAQDEGSAPNIAPRESSIDPMATFILYAPMLMPIVGGFNQAMFQGYAQIQGNMKYIVCGQFALTSTPLIASAADTSSALLLNYLVTPYPNPQPNQFQVPMFGTVNVDGTTQFLGMVTEQAFYWGFYTTELYDVEPTTTTVITPGLYEISQTLAWPNTDLSSVDLTGFDFSGRYQFQGSDFQQAILDQVNFTETNLSGANFSGASLVETNLTTANVSEANFSGALLTGTNFTQANLTGANLSAVLAGTNFTGATLTNADFTGALASGTNFAQATLAGANFTGCDLFTFFPDGPTFVTPTQSGLIIFRSALLPFTLLNQNWQWLDLRNSTVTGMPVPPVLSSATNVLQATGAMLSGMNQNNFTGVTLKSAVLNYADLDGLDMSGANLTNAKLIDTSLHGTNLSGATLTSANMTGAQLGSLGYLFTVPLSVEPALNAGQVSALTSYFAQIGITLSSSATLKTIVANRVWELNDVGNNIVYSIRLEAPSATDLTVYWPAVAGSLVNAYMPDAVLTGANLYGVLANNIQFYGSGARIDGAAVLEEAQFNGSNLSKVNFTLAQLMGTNLSGSYLFNAQFNGANMTPSANGVATNLSDANLQGADFTDAQLFGANLANAAVAINIPTKANPNQGGVYLFSLPYTGDTNTLQQYIAELNAAATQFSLNPNGDEPTLQKYVTALETNNLATLKVPFLEQSPPITLSNNAQIQTIDSASVWQIVDGQNSYTLWTDIDENGDTELYAAPSLTKTQAAFQQNGIMLRWQASATIDTAGQQWLLDNDSENPQNLSTGYMSFLLKVDGTVLDVYGTALRIIRLGKKNKEEYDTETCNVTTLTLANMTGSTICPNSAMLSTNQNTSGEQWDTKWLRASALPKPPTCVPTEFSWCPPTSTSSDAQHAEAQAANKRTR